MRHPAAPTLASIVLVALLAHATQARAQAPLATPASAAAPAATPKPPAVPLPATAWLVLPKVAAVRAAMPLRR